jgi:hypothetical protein
VSLSHPAAAKVSVIDDDGRPNAISRLYLRTTGSAGPIGWPRKINLWVYHCIHLYQRIRRAVTYSENGFRTGSAPRAIVENTHSILTAFRGEAMAKLLPSSSSCSGSHEGSLPPIFGHDARDGLTMLHIYVMCHPHQTITRPSAIVLYHERYHHMGPSLVRSLSRRLAWRSDFDRSNTISGSRDPQSKPRKLHQASTHITLCPVRHRFVFSLGCRLR